MRTSNLHKLIQGYYYYYGFDDIDEDTFSDLIQAVPLLNDCYCLECFVNYSEYKQSTFGWGIYGIIEQYSRIKVSQRVYNALKKIGKPSHYSKIANEYNVMYPHLYMDEKNVHSSLVNDRDKLGFVWIGIK